MILMEAGKMATFSFSISRIFRRGRLCHLYELGAIVGIIAENGDLSAPFPLRGVDFNDHCYWL